MGGINLRQQPPQVVGPGDGKGTFLRSSWRRRAADVLQR